jgi:transcriptional regulator with XRE-family HTH domain
VLTQIGKTMRARRVELALSQEAIAAEAGIDRSYYSAAERGEVNLTVVLLCEIARALGTTPETLVASASTAQ